MTAAAFQGMSASFPFGSLLSTRAIKSSTGTDKVGTGARGAAVGVGRYWRDVGAAGAVSAASGGGGAGDAKGRKRSRA
jgi:hypothetical protein